MERLRELGLKEHALLTVRDVSKFTGYSEYHIRRMIKSGKMAAMKPSGGRYLISQSNIVEFLKRGGQ